MKRQMQVDLYKDFLDDKILEANASKEIHKIEECQIITSCDHTTYNRKQSDEEKEFISEEGFKLLMFWVRNGDISIDFFEKFISILSMDQEGIYPPLDEETLITMFEIMRVSRFQDSAIYSIMTVYFERPCLLDFNLTTIH